MADEEHQAKIEAVARAIYGEAMNQEGRENDWDDLSSRDRTDWLGLAEAATTALDRVCDARGDDEAKMTHQAFERWADSIGLTDAQRGPVLYVLDREYDRGRAARFPQSEDHRVRPCPHCGSRSNESVCSRCGHANPPQDEDHESGIEALMKRTQMPRQWVEDLVGVYLARVSPSRDGTVAVEDVEAALVRRLEGPRQPGVCVTVNIDGFMAEFSPASTGDQESSKRNDAI